MGEVMEVSLAESVLDLIQEHQDLLNKEDLQQLLDQLQVNIICFIIIYVRCVFSVFIILNYVPLSVTDRGTYFSMIDKD